MKHTILLVDDDVTILRGYERLFRRDGWSVMRSADPVRAAPMLEGCDVVITDWDMPNGGGLRMVSEARQAGVPVIVHSGSNKQEIEEQANAVVMSKPCSFSELKAQAIKAISQKGTNK